MLQSLRIITSLARLSCTAKNVRTLSYKLECAAVSLPHPEKASTGGEDAFFILEDKDKWAVGIADGVGGWAEVGVDSGEYSRLLMTQAKDRLASSKAPCPLDALNFAWRQASQTKGSATACVCVLDPAGRLRTLNVGDSGFLLLRPLAAVVKGGAYESVHMSEFQQHRFNTPFQLGFGSRDKPHDGLSETLAVQRGDVLVLATDGLWDNLPNGRIIETVRDAASRQESPRGQAKGVCQALVAEARRWAERTSGKDSPFSRAAAAAGLLHLGGKMDDITVVVGVVDGARADDPAKGG